MRVKEEISQIKKDVDQELEDFFIEKGKDHKKISDFYTQAFSLIAEFTISGGKRIRPALFIKTYEGLSGKDITSIKKVSIYLELMHSYLLIHDDFFDKAYLRRGLPTINAYFRKFAQDNKYSDPKHSGNVLSVLVGNIAYSLANQVILESSLSKEKKLYLLDSLQRRNIDVTIGQMGDFLLSLKKDYTKEDVLFVDKFKTSSYTFLLPMKSGAILAEAGSKSLSHIHKYAEFMGVAFQIRDDILGVFGSEEKIGKSINSDLQEGKKTLLLLKAIENSNSKQRKFLSEHVGNPKLNKTQADNIREIFHDTEALTYAEKLSNYYSTKAKSEIENIGFVKKETVDLFYDLSDYMVKRNV